MRFDYREVLSDDLSFLRMYIGVLSLGMPREYQLSPKEVNFVALVVYANSLGVDISEHTALFEFMVENSEGEFVRKKDLSTYKSKVSQKKWFRSSWGELQLPENLRNINNLRKEGKLEAHIKLSTI